MPFLRVPLIFYRFFVDALTNGPKSIIIWLGLSVPKNGDMVHKIIFEISNNPGIPEAAHGKKK